MLDFQKIDFTQDTKFSNLDINFNANEIYIDKSSIGKDDKEKLNFNMLAVGRINPEAKKLIAALSNNKFFLTSHKNGISLFTKFVNGESFLPSFNNKDVKVWNDTFYTLDKPISGEQPNSRLLVVFSSIADLAFNANIDRRMFFKNFPNVAKYIPKNTYILRIADIGGVLGGFYLNSHADMDFESKVQSLIRKIQLEHAIPDEYTVLYGTSKGATGALYHGIKMGLKAVSVDPIISDIHYVEKFNDLHFVEGAFPIAKQDKFKELFDEYKHQDLTHIKLISSQNSEQFEYISELILLPKIGVCSYLFNNPSIKGHTTIGENTLNFVTAMLNNTLYAIDTKSEMITSY